MPKQPNKTLTIIRFWDASQVEAAGMEPGKAVPELALMEETGWLLAEDENAVLIGMEAAAETHEPGRWRLNIPKKMIVQRSDFNVNSKFSIRSSRKKRESKDKECPHQSVNPSISNTKN
jgi:hypothetical protein